jgi:outer membrane protein
VKRSVIVLLSAAALTGFASLASAETKIGVVSTNVLMRDAPQVRMANEAIRAEFAPKEKEIQTLAQQLKTREEQLNKDAPTMTEMQRNAAMKELTEGNRTFAFKKDAFEEDLKTRSDQESQRLQIALLTEVQAFGKANGYDLILSEGVLFATPAYDVTGPVLEALKKKAAAPAAPAAAAPAPASRPAAPAATTPAKP